jgi:hypothetical protein
LEWRANALATDDWFGTVRGIYEKKGKSIFCVHVDDVLDVSFVLVAVG